MKPMSNCVREIKTARIDATRLAVELTDGSTLTVPELAVLVEAPTLDPAIREQRARVRRAAADRYCGSQIADHDRRRRVVHRAVPELAFRVLTPALRGAVRQDRARMRAAATDRRSRRSRSRATRRGVRRRDRQ